MQLHKYTPLACQGRPTENKHADRHVTYGPALRLGSLTCGREKRAATKEILIVLFLTVASFMAALDYQPFDPCHYTFRRIYIKADGHIFRSRESSSSC